MKMAKPYAIKFYNSKEWKKCRRSYIKKVHGLCEHCLKEGKHIPGYIVDHIEEITPFDMFPLTHHIECVSLLSLKNCNKKTEKSSKKDKKQNGRRNVTQ